MTPAEVYVATKFATDITSKIDSRDFREDSNDRRTPKKIYDDNLRGKLAELMVFNSLSNIGYSPEIDLDVYDLGIGDSFDIRVDNVNIDLKASTKAARCLMVEQSRYDYWKKYNKSPDYLALISVDKGADDVWEVNWKFGAPLGLFVSEAKLIDKGDMIPNTNTPLKASNYVLPATHGHGGQDFLMWLNGEM